MKTLLLAACLIVISGCATHQNSVTISCMGGYTLNMTIAAMDETEWKRINDSGEPWGAIFRCSPEE